MSQGVQKPDVITISRSEYEGLIQSEAKLNALEMAGVDNWEGYSDALATLEPVKEEKKVEPSPEAAATAESAVEPKESAS